MTHSRHSATRARPRSRVSELARTRAHTGRLRLVQRGAPWTTQKVLHVLILIAASVRVLFFYVASVAWDMGKGELSASEPVW